MLVYYYMIHDNDIAYRLYYKIMIDYTPKRAITEHRTTVIIIMTKIAESYILT